MRVAAAKRRRRAPSIRGDPFNAMVLVVILALSLAIVLGPQFWVKRVMARNAVERPEFPGDGGELARHLLDRLDLQNVRVERTEHAGDHYDPIAKAVRLSPENYDGRSLTAVTVAAHEVGHAMQDRDGYGPLRARHLLVRFAKNTQRVAQALAIAAPLIGLALRAPGFALWSFVAIVAAQAIAVALQLITLPVELDASFRRALPMLRSGYIAPGDHAAARQILTAAALTYVAAALFNILNLARWLRPIR